MDSHRPTGSHLLPVAVATAVSLGLYWRQALLLLLKVGEVFGGVFDTSVPAFPLAGMLFVLMFIWLRRKEFSDSFAGARPGRRTGAVGAAMVFLPLLPLFLWGKELAGSYSFAAVALTTCWVGALAILKPRTLKFLWPYLVSYLLAIGSVGLLTGAFGDPLATVVADISRAITSALSLPVTWTSVNMSFPTAGGSAMTLYISQECSGVASMAVFVLLVAMMHLDFRPTMWVSVIIAAGGSALFLLLNSLRVVVLIIGGIYYGQDVLWNLHGWVGYVFYVAGYAALLLVFLRAARPGTEARLANPGQGDSPERNALLVD